MSEFRVPPQDEIRMLTPEQRAKMAAAYMAELEPGRQPLELFTQMARLAVLSTMEVVPLRTQEEQTEVLLTQRPENDKWWAGQWHVPGTVPLVTDSIEGFNGFSGAMERIFDGELGGIEVVGEPQLFEADRRRGTRGDEQTPRFWAEVKVPDGLMLPPVGRFFDVDNLLAEQLPDEPILITGHAKTIARAAASYEKYRQEHAS